MRSLRKHVKLLAFIYISQSLSKTISILQLYQGNVFQRHGKGRCYERGYVAGKGVGRQAV